MVNARKVPLKSKPLMSNEQPFDTSFLKKLGVKGMTAIYISNIILLLKLGQKEGGHQITRVDTAKITGFRKERGFGSPTCTTIKTAMVKDNTTCKDIVRLSGQKYGSKININEIRSIMR